jgi:hypothetical protein
MSEQAPSTPPALHALCQQAGRRAAQWSTPAAETSARGPLLKWALVTGAGGLALAVLAAQFEATPPPAAARTGAEAAAPAAPQPQAAGGPADPVHWQGDELVMAFDGMPLQQAVAWLAQATHSHVSGTEVLEPVPVTLQHRGRDLPAAWRLLLQGHAAVALSCGAPPCRVWLSRAAEAPGAAAGPAAPRTTSPPGAGPADTAPGEIESQPGGSC